MVQSIWLEIRQDKSSYFNSKKLNEIIKEQEEEELCDKILTIINMEYPIEIFNETIDPIRGSKYDGKRYSVEGGFALRNREQLKELIKEAGYNPDKIDSCGCDFCKSNPTVGEQMVKLFGIRVTAKQVGRNMWGDVGLQTERLRVLYILLKKIQTLLGKYNIKSEIDLSDVNIEELHGLLTQKELEKLKD